jgi:UDP-glucuronate 4-epimerase
VAAGQEGIVTDERFLVTGGTGCIGAWVVRDLVREGTPVTAVSSRARPDRLRLLLSGAELAALDLVAGDVADLVAMEALARDRGVTRIIHLAALQLPFCAADPVAGARVNVTGTAVMLEVARRIGIGRLVYASSAAVFGPRSHYRLDTGAELPADAVRHPTSFYGVYKVANEDAATVAWETQGTASIGLRPHSVYGPGRDQGMTSKPTVAMIAAAAGRPYHVAYGGRYQFQFADDAARTFIAAARTEQEGAEVYSLPGPAIGVDEVVMAIEQVAPSVAGRITVEDQELALPSAFDAAPLEAALGPQPLTPLEDGVRQTIETYRAAIADGRLDGAWLARVLGA